MGSKTALANIADGIDAKWISNSQKEEMATKGALLTLTGLGVNAIEIPQTFIRGTYDFKVANNEIFVLPDTEAPIKVYFEGNTCMRDRDYLDNHDQVYDSQIQSKVGVGVVVSNLIGKYTIQ